MSEFVERPKQRRVYASQEANWAQLLETLENGKAVEIPRSAYSALLRRAHHAGYALRSSGLNQKVMVPMWLEVKV